MLAQKKYKKQFNHLTNLPPPRSAYSTKTQDSESKITASGKFSRHSLSFSREVSGCVCMQSVFFFLWLDGKRSLEPHDCNVETTVKL